MLHLLASRDPKAATTKCGRTVTYAETTAWWRDVDCPACIERMTDDIQRKINEDDR
jgi:hypothetical protein